MSGFYLAVGRLNQSGKSFADGLELASFCFGKLAPKAEEVKQSIIEIEKESGRMDFLVRFLFSLLAESQSSRSAPRNPARRADRGGSQDRRRRRRIWNVFPIRKSRLLGFPFWYHAEEGHFPGHRRRNWWTALSRVFRSESRMVSPGSVLDFQHDSCT